MCMDTAPNARSELSWPLDVWVRACVFCASLHSSVPVGAIFHVHLVFHTNKVSISKHTTCIVVKLYP